MGYVFTVAECAINWKAELQDTIVLAQGYITRFYGFDDNKIYIVICTNQV